MFKELVKKDNLVLIGGAALAVSTIMYLTGSFFGLAAKKHPVFGVMKPEKGGYAFGKNRPTGFPSQSVAAKVKDFLPNQHAWKHALLNDEARPVHTENLVRYIVTHSYEPRAVAPRMKDIRQLMRTHTSELASLATQLANGTITREEYLAKVKLIAQQVAAELKINIQPKHKPKVSNTST